MTVITKNIGTVSNPERITQDISVSRILLIAGGVAVGTYVGFQIGGPLGAAVGALVGAFVGTLASCTVKNMTIHLSPTGGVTVSFESSFY
jgi:outer membrane lipoprotein SlyB